MAKLFANYNDRNRLSVSEESLAGDEYSGLSIEELNESAFQLSMEILNNDYKIDKYVDGYDLALEELSNISFATTNNLIQYTLQTTARRLGISTESLHGAELSTEGIIQNIISGIVFLLKKIGEFIANIWRAIMEFLGFSEKRTEYYVQDTEETKKIIKSVLADSKSDKTNTTYTVKVKKDLKIIKSQQEEINKLKEEVANSKKPITVNNISTNLAKAATVTPNETNKEKIARLVEKYDGVIKLSGVGAKDWHNDISPAGTPINEGVKFRLAVYRAIYILTLVGLKPNSLFTQAGASAAADKFTEYVNGMTDVIAALTKIGKEIIATDSSAFNSGVATEIYNKHSAELNRGYKKGLAFLQSDLYSFGKPEIKNIIRDNYGWSIARLNFDSDFFVNPGNAVGNIELYSSDTTKLSTSSTIFISKDAALKIEDLYDLEFTLKPNEITKITKCYKNLKEKITKAHASVRSNCGEILPRVDETNELKRVYLSNLSRTLGTFTATLKLVQLSVLHISEVVNRYAKLENEYVALIGGLE